MSNASVDASTEQKIVRAKAGRLELAKRLGGRIA
jgi:hypothetical protein